MTEVNDWIILIIFILGILATFWIGMDHGYKYAKKDDDIQGLEKVIADLKKSVEILEGHVDFILTEMPRNE